MKTKILKYLDKLKNNKQYPINKSKVVARYHLVVHREKQRVLKEIKQFVEKL